VTLFAVGNDQAGSADRLVGGISYTGSDTGMGQRGFTRQELQDIFDLDLDRPEDRPVIAALQASWSRHNDTAPPSSAARSLRRAALQLFRKPSKRAA